MEPYCVDFLSLRTDKTRTEIEPLLSENEYLPEFHTPIYVMGNFDLEKEKLLCRDVWGIDLTEQRKQFWLSQSFVHRICIYPERKLKGD